MAFPYIARYHKQNRRTVPGPMPQTPSISPEKIEALETAIREAPVPQPPLSAGEIDQLLAEARAYGVDLSLLGRNLQLSPTERLEKLQGAAEFILELQTSMHHNRHETP